MRENISNHAEGCESRDSHLATYTWLDSEGDIPEGPFSEAPVWLLEMAGKTGTATAAPGPMRVPAVIKQGVQHLTLFKFACSQWARGDMDPATVEAACIAMSKRCEPIPPEEDVRKIVRSVCKRYLPGKSAQYNGKDGRRFLEEFPDPSDADVPGDIPGPVLVPDATPQPDAPEAHQASVQQSGGYMHNDTGNANRLVAAYGKDLIWCEERKSFFFWTGSRWKLDKGLIPMKLARRVLLAAHAEAEEIEDDAKRKKFLKFLSLSLNRSGIANMVEVSKLTLRQVGAADFDSGVYLLNFKNGTLELRTGLLREHRREDLISKQIPYAFNAKAECRIFMRFLRRIMGDYDGATPEQRERADRLIAYLQRLFGCACNGIPAKILAMFWGTGDNGKSTLVEIIRWTLGGEEYAGQLQIESLMANAKDAAGSNAINADVAGLQGCRFVTASEPDKGSRFATARIKHLLGLTKIKARFLKENPFSFTPSHKLFIDCNDKPVITNSADAIFNRVKLFPFTVTIPKAEIDPTLLEKLKEELPGIMAWLAIGAAEYLMTGLGEIPEVSAATEEYRSESDSLSTFYESECVLLPRAWVSKTELWSRYQNWAASKKIPFPFKKDIFEDRIIRDGCRETRKNHNAVRAWEGIALQPPASPEGDKGDNGGRVISYESSCEKSS